MGTGLWKGQDRTGEGPRERPRKGRYRGEWKGQGTRRYRGTSTGRSRPLAAGPAHSPHRETGPKRSPLTVGPPSGTAKADTGPATFARFTKTHLATEREQTHVLLTSSPPSRTTTPIAPRGELHPSLRTPPRRVAGLARFPFPARLALVPAAAAEPCASAILSVCGGGGGGSGRARYRRLRRSRGAPRRWRAERAAGEGRRCAL